MLFFQRFEENELVQSDLGTPSCILRKGKHPKVPTIWKFIPKVPTFPKSTHSIFYHSNRHSFLFYDENLTKQFNQPTPQLAGFARTRSLRTLHSNSEQRHIHLTVWEKLFTSPGVCSIFLLTSGILENQACHNRQYDFHGLV